MKPEFSLGASRRVYVLALDLLSRRCRDATALSHINTPLQRGDCQGREIRNRFNGFGAVWKTVKTVPGLFPARPTPLKRGVNERGSSGKADLGTDRQAFAKLLPAADWNVPASNAGIGS